MTEEDPNADLIVRFSGSFAALINSEAMIEDREPEEIIIKAMNLYSGVATEMRHGAKLFLEIDNGVEASRIRLSRTKRIGRSISRLLGLNPDLNRYEVLWGSDET